MRILGFVLLGLSALLVLLALLSDTTVGTGFGQRVHNIGLLGRKQNLLMLGGFAGVTGALLTFHKPPAGTRRLNRERLITASSEVLRTLVGLIAGVLLALLTIMAVETLGHSVAPPPAGYDMNAGSALALPVSNLLFPVIGWFVGTFAGAFAASRISRAQWTGWTVAAIVLLGAVASFVMITHPLWVMAAGVVAPLLAGWLAQQLARAPPPL